MEAEVEERIEQIVRSAVQRRAEDREEDDCSRCWWKMSDGYRKVLMPVACLALGSVLTFIINTKTSSATQAVELENEAKLVNELRANTVSKEVLEAKIQPMASDIADIKKSLEELRRFQKDSSQEKVIYRTYKLASTTEP